MEEEIGRVTHYFTRIGVAAIDIKKGELKVGDTIHIKGHTTDFYQKIDSMQIEHQPVEKAEAGQSVGIKVSEHVRENDIVYKVTEE
jgi:putative protease